MMDKVNIREEGEKERNFILFRSLSSVSLLSLVDTGYEMRGKVSLMRENKMPTVITRMEGKEGAMIWVCLLIIIMKRVKKRFLALQSVCPCFVSSFLRTVTCFSFLCRERIFPPTFKVVQEKLPVGNNQTRVACVKL